LVACVRTEPSVGKCFQTHQTQPDVAHRYRTHRTHRTQSPDQESQDATLLYLMQATFLLMNGLRVHPPMGFTFRNISAIDLFVGNLKTRVSYDGKAGLEHVAVVARLEMGESVDMTRRRPSWRNIPVSGYDDILEHVDSGDDEGMWSRLRSGVDALARSGRNVGRCRFWNPDLQRIRSDLNHLRRIRRWLLTVSDD